MELWQAILYSVIKKYEGEMILELDMQKLFENKCYSVLAKIKAILEDDTQSDNDCFEKIESIVCLFEEIGSGCGTRHDFG